MRLKTSAAAAGLRAATALCGIAIFLHACAPGKGTRPLTHASVVAPAAIDQRGTARNGVDCPHDRVCQSLGHCTTAGDRCVASSDQQCRTSLRCYVDGQCAAMPTGWCGAVSSGDCLASSQCRESDHCRLDHGGCSLSSVNGCKKACAAFGKCTPSGETCIATSDRDCAASELCEFAGHCHLLHGECAAATTADCRRSDACTDRGLCVFVEEEGCAATNDGDCISSDACRSMGRCRAKWFACVRER